MYIKCYTLTQVYIILTSTKGYIMFNIDNTKRVPNGTSVRTVESFKPFTVQSDIAIYDVEQRNKRSSGMYVSLIPTMELGDSFFAPLHMFVNQKDIDENPTQAFNKVRNGFSSGAKAHGYKFTSRRCTENGTVGFRFWRISNTKTR